MNVNALRNTCHHQEFFLSRRLELAIKTSPNASDEDETRLKYVHRNIERFSNVNQYTKVF